MYEIFSSSSKIEYVCHWNKSKRWFQVHAAKVLCDEQKDDYTVDVVYIFEKSFCNGDTYRLILPSEGFGYFMCAFKTTRRITERLFSQRLTINYYDYNKQPHWIVKINAYLYGVISSMLLYEPEMDQIMEFYTKRIKQSNNQAKSCNQGL